MLVRLPTVADLKAAKAAKPAARKPRQRANGIA
jgi:hypothetical protein